MKKKITWPENKTFAFTIFDDTDNATVKNVREIYALLGDHGFRTTKSVWPGHDNAVETTYGSTCQDKKYLEWAKSLKEIGFEIGFHMANAHSSFREETLQGLENFTRYFGHPPKVMANHDQCQENLYWGGDRLTGINALFYRLVTKGKKNNYYRGHIEGDKYFWGDFCKKDIKYVRNFTFSHVDTLKVCPMMPYHDPWKPYVNYWFSSTDGQNIAEFNKRFDEKTQDSLEASGGLCIVYTHFGSGFFHNGSVDSRFKALIKRLSKKNGWYVPVSEVLDYLLKIKGPHILNRSERWRLEKKWIFDRIKMAH